MHASAFVLLKRRSAVLLWCLLAGLSPAVLSGCAVVPAPSVVGHPTDSGHCGHCRRSAPAGTAYDSSPAVPQTYPPTATTPAPVLPQPVPPETPPAASPDSALEMSADAKSSAALRECDALRQEAEAVRARLDQLQAQLEHERQERETVQNSLAAMNARVGELSSELDFWKNEVQRIDEEAERQHADDLASLEAIADLVARLPAPEPASEESGAAGSDEQPR